MSTPQPSAGNLSDYGVQRLRWIMQRDCRPDALPDAHAWQDLRPLVHQRLLASLGLDPLPPRCDLKPIVTGTFSGQGFTATKLGYQWLPDCWGSAHLYRPSLASTGQPIPGVLYACGHDLSGVESYAHHGIAWARRGYACLVFETIEQSDNPGDHHVLNRGDAPHWIALQYSAAGAEVWNGIRALDLLLSQPGIDPLRVGVTGISGGGAQAFFLACTDDRLRAAAAVGGISDPLHAIANRQVQQHCDCMYLRNSYAHDLSTFAALIAPRSLLMAFARGDAYFTPAEFRDLHRRCHARFERLGCADHCALLEYDGPHGYNEASTFDTIHRWFDQHVAGQAHPDVDTLAVAQEPALDRVTLSVFQGSPPQPNRLELLPHLLTTRGTLTLPATPHDWPALRQAAVERLRREVYCQLDEVQAPLALEPCGQWQLKQGQTRAWRGTLDGMAMTLYGSMPGDESHDTLVLAVGRRPQTALAVARAIAAETQDPRVAVLALEPRACGVNAFAPEHQTYFNRIGCLAGLTPTMMIVQDLHHLWAMLRDWPCVRGRRVVLVGEEEGALALLHHALLHDEAAAQGLVLSDLPAGYERSPHQVMGVLRVMDQPQAVALLAPRTVALVRPGGHQTAWTLPMQAFDRCGGKLFRAANLASALAHVLARPR